MLMITIGGPGVSSPHGRMPAPMYEMSCSEIWGGTRNQDQDVCAGDITATLYSHACDGGRGGDIYFFSLCGQAKLTRLIVADVVGHGESVNSVSRWVSDLLVEHMNDPSMAIMMKTLNDLACEHGLDAMTTAVVLSFIRSDGSLSVISAGHHAPAVCRAGEQRWAPLYDVHDVAEGDADDGRRIAGPPLGVVGEAIYPERAGELQPGDRLFVFTDGVHETPNADGKLYGTDRLYALLNEHVGAPLHDLKRAVLDDLRAFRGNGTPGILDHDDVTLLGIEVR